jgi:hypothetical protein
MGRKLFLFSSRTGLLERKLMSFVRKHFIIIIIIIIIINYQ